MALRLRPGLFALLVCLLLVSWIQLLPREASSQSSPVSDSWAKLVQALQSVQEADRLGAPSDEAAQLSSELNLALAYYGNASQLFLKGNLTESYVYAQLSIKTSSSVMSKAIALQNEAEGQRTTTQALAYLAALGASLLSAIVVMEYHRIPLLLRKRRFLKTKLT